MNARSLTDTFCSFPIIKQVIKLWRESYEAGLASAQLRGAVLDAAIRLSMEKGSSLMPYNAKIDWSHVEREADRFRRICDVLEDYADETTIEGQARRFIRLMEAYFSEEPPQ